MGKKNKQASEDIAPKTHSAEESVKRIENITNIRDEITSILGGQPGSSYCLYVKKHVVQPNGGATWSYIGRITGEDMADVQEKLLEYSPGIYRLEAHYEKSKKLVPGLPEFEQAVGDIQEASARPSSLIHRDSSVMPNRTPGSNADPVETHPDVVKAKVSAEVVKAKIDEVIAKRDLAKAEKGDDGMDNNALTMLMTQMSNMFSTSMEKIAQMISSNQPKSNPDSELLSKISRLEDKISQGEQSRAQSDTTKAIMDSQSQIFRSMSESNQKIFDAMRADSTNQMNLVMKMIETMGQKNSPDGEWKNMERIMKLVDWKDARQKANEPEEVDETPEPQSPAVKFFNSAVEGIINLQNNGVPIGDLLSSVFKKPDNPQFQYTKEQVQDAIKKDAMGIITNMQAKGYKFVKVPAADGQVVIHEPAKAPAVIPPLAPGVVVTDKLATGGPTTDKIPTVPLMPAITPPVQATEEDKKKIMDTTLDILLDELETLPAEPKWALYAYDNFTPDMMAVVKNAKSQLEIFDLVKKYGDSKLTGELIAKIATDANRQKWLGECFAGIQAALNAKKV